MHAPDLGPARWVTSSYSSANADCVEVAALPARWVTSSYSSSNANCVQVGATPGTLAVRDSKDPAGPALVLPAAHWASFVRALRAREWRVES